MAEIEPAVQEFLTGRLCRVGGLALTEAALAACGFPAGAKLADIGCGQGATVALLRAAGYQAVGLDHDPDLPLPPHCARGKAEALPYAEATLAGLFFECSLSKIAAPAQALGEARRVLETAGKLIISDLYARGDTAQFAGRLGRLLRLADWQALLRQAGFRIIQQTEHSEALRELTAQLLWQSGEAALQQLFGGCYDPALLRRCRPGYFLLIATKEANDAFPA